MHRIWLVLIPAIVLFTRGHAQIGLVRDFENGNGLLIFQDARSNEVAIQPEIKRRDRELVWFHAKLYGFRKDTLLTLHLPFQRAAYAPDPLCVQVNGSWQRIPAETRNFYKTYRFACTADTLTLATGVPYTYADLRRELQNLKPADFLQVETLCRSEEGLDVPLLRFCLPRKKPKGTIYLQARQHAFEAPSSFFIQGIWEELVRAFGEKGSALADFQVLLVPMMDVDNVREGAYGKDQFPVDFNRNWVATPHWNAVKAVQKRLRKESERAPLIFTLDCHAPHPITRSFSHYYLALPDSAVQTQNIKRLMALHQVGEGYRMNSQRNNRIKKGEGNFNGWVHGQRSTGKPEFPGLLCGTTYEQSWQSKPDGTAYTPAEIKKSGGRFVRALAEFLREKGHGKD